MKTTTKDYLLLTIFGMLISFSVIELINIFNNIDVSMSKNLLVLSVVLLLCFMFIVKRISKYQSLTNN